MLECTFIRQIYEHLKPWLFVEKKQYIANKFKFSNLKMILMERNRKIEIDFVEWEWDLWEMKWIDEWTKLWFEITLLGILIDTKLSLVER